MAWGSVIGQLDCGAANLGCKPVFSRLGRAGKRVRRQNCLPHRPVRRQTDPLPRLSTAFPRKRPMPVAAGTPGELVIEERDPSSDAAEIPNTLQEIAVF